MRASQIEREKEGGRKREKEGENGECLECGHALCHVHTIEIVDLYGTHRGLSMHTPSSPVRV